MEIADPAMLHLTVLELLLRLECPVDLLVANAGFRCPRGSFIRSDGHVCGALQRRTTLRSNALMDLRRFPNGVPRQRSIGLTLGPASSSQARHIYAPDANARSFALRLIGRRKVIELKPNGRRSSRAAKKQQFGQSVGIVAIGNGIAEYRLMKHVARALNRELPDRSIVVIGETIDDIGLMRLDNVHVTGAVQTTEHDSDIATIRHWRAFHSNAAAVVRPSRHHRSCAPRSDRVL